MRFLSYTALVLKHTSVRPDLSKAGRNVNCEIALYDLLAELLSFFPSEFLPRLSTLLV